MATLIKPLSPYKSSKKTIEPENSTDFNLQELYRHLECDTIEVSYLNSEEMMIMDENAKITERLINTDATFIYRKQHKVNDYICGPVILCKVSELN
jgi:hypothetical protein